MDSGYVWCGGPIVLAVAVFLFAAMTDRPKLLVVFGVVAALVVLVAAVVALALWFVANAFTT